MALVGTVAAAVALLHPSTAQASVRSEEPISSACYMSYAIDPTASTFEGEIARALGVITRHTGISFVAGDSGLPEIALTFRALPDPGMRSDGTVPLGYWSARDRTIFLTPVPRSLRYPLVLHETMHAVGVGHATDPHNVSSALLSDRTRLGRQDLAALQQVRAARACAPATASARS